MTTQTSVAPELETALAALAQAKGWGALSALRRLSGGASQETWSFEAGGARYILRRSPPSVVASPSSMAIGLETEAALMQAAARAGVPSPEVKYILREEDGAGRGFVQSFVEGETLGGRIVKDAAYAEARKTLARQCGDILARIHQIKDAPPLPTKSPKDQLAGLYEGYKAENWPRPVFSLAFKWLQDRTPDTSDDILVHGDFRNGNLIVGPDGVRAVLDWEIAQRGDPMQDLGWLCVNSWRFGGIDKPVGGFGSREDLFAGYEAAGGGRVDPERVKFWEIFGTLRWGVMCTFSAVRFAMGGDISIDRPMIARRASETELDLVDLMQGRA